ncbi:hypothetical protein J6V85_02340, partial [Candidatus Saccharibacteria bacterium]|nr:hypothetical protein [Candidatus Saccharibacteria bacterium]
TIFRDEATMLAPISLTPPSGKVFAGWNTAADGSGTSYTNQQSVTNIAADGGTITLYAQWVTNLYDMVASMSKGKQSQADLQAVITQPTSSNPATDTSNSGVYEYDASIFGTSSDASNDYPIYYYRGILDSDLSVNNSSFTGSTGNSAFYPNYVRLGDTCWRIFRTTGSGGVKMIYNGLYSATSEGTCANNNNNAMIGYDSNWYGSYDLLVTLGYTRNSSYLASTAYTVPISTALGSNTDYSVNNSNSTIKSYLEDTWFTSNNGIGDYERLLEPSAGYCNDRSIYDGNTNTLLDESTNIVTYNSTFYHFGAALRNLTPGGMLSLSCPRNIVDLYTTNLATDGNRQLNKPVALITADEAALSGVGYSGRTTPSTYSSNYSYSSFLTSGIYWTLSPLRYSGTAYATVIYGNYQYFVNAAYRRGLRPVVSLKPGTTAVSGSGTATDPWVVKAPTTIEKAYERAGATKLNGYYQMQDMTPEICNSVEAINHQTQVIDNRDNEVYWVAKLADGNCWMTQNLDHDIITTQNFYTYANTDIGHGATIDTTATWTASTATYGTSNTTWNPGSGPESYNPGEICWDGVLVSGTTRTINDASVTCSDAHYHYGNYYNFLAATATNNFDYVYLDHDKSICPAGWTLPKAETSGSSKTYKRLGDELSLTAGASGNSHQAPVYFIYSGNWNNGSSFNVGSIGYYWTPQQLGSDIATLAGPANLYDFSERVGGVWDGLPVRCVAR